MIKSIMTSFYQNSMGYLMSILENDKDALRFLDVKLANWGDFLDLFTRFSFNFIIILIIARGLYYAKARRKDYLFTFIVISVVTFILCFTLNNVKLQLGFAFGLFAVFGIIRYRTDTMPIKEMSYLFLIIGISLINSLTNKKVSYVELLFVNLIVIAIVYVLEYLWLLKHETRQVIFYERIDLIAPDKRAELKADLEKRTGLKISRIELGKINFLKDVVKITIYYFESENVVNMSAESDFSPYAKDDE